jgi:hypothetical protein
VLDMLHFSIVVLLVDRGRVGLSVFGDVVEVTLSILERDGAE